MLQTWLLYSVGCNFGMAGLFVWTMLAGGRNGRIPTFVVVWLCCRLKGAKFVIDWHNLGYTLLALSRGSGHFFVKVREPRWDVDLGTLLIHGVVCLF